MTLYKRLFFKCVNWLNLLFKSINYSYIQRYLKRDLVVIDVNDLYNI